MKNNAIYKSALSLIAQSTADGENLDYQERAPYIIAAFCSDTSEIDAAFRKHLGLPVVSNFEKIFLDLNEDFPLLEKFAAVAAKYLAAMLVIDEDSELSDRLFAMYCDAISLIKNELPMALEKIADKYL